VSGPYTRRRRTDQIASPNEIANPIATEITDFVAFYPAEDYHQHYYERTGHEPYCHVLPAGLLEELGLVGQSR